MKTKIKCNLLLVVFLLPLGVFAGVVTLVDPSEVSTGSEVDLNGDGNNEFYSFYDLDGWGGRPTAWNMFMSGSVEFQFSDSGLIKVFSVGDILGPTVIDGTWEIGPHDVVAGGSTYDTYFSVGMSDPPLDNAQLQPQEWESPFDLYEFGFLGFRFSQDSNYHYGYIQLNFYKDGYLVMPGEDPVLVYEHSAFADIQGISFEDAGNIPIEIVAIPENQVWLIPLCSLGIAAYFRKKIQPVAGGDATR